MMKRLLIITVLVFGVLVAFGQKNVSDKENETAPKTALLTAVFCTFATQKIGSYYKERLYHTKRLYN